jgi:hypothetical protein
VVRQHYLGILLSLARDDANPAPPTFTATQPANRIRSDNFCVVDSPILMILVFVYLLEYASLFILPWNFEFPTSAERTLLRISSVCMVCFCSLIAIVLTIADWFYFSKRRPLEKPARKPSPKEEDVSTSWIVLSSKRVLDRMRNIHEDKDHMLEVPLRILFPATLLCALYSITRVYILLEDIIALRAMEPILLKGVKWF